MLDLIFPKKCILCSKKTNYICNSCIDDLCKKYSYANNATDEKFLNVFYGFKYQNEIRNMVIQLKFNDKKYVSRAITQLILTKVNHINFNDYDFISPIPASNARKYFRGYNQCELILKDICKFKNVKCTNILTRKHKKAQSKLNSDDRRQNIKGVFSVTQHLQNKRILLFDDVLTTGSTMNEAILEIKKHRPLKIDVIIFAKT